ncbi:beta strand repeat-containing protein [Hymenobacter convexus]|uniref:beta strand repeat-containing protein n=1 Tax=Hymenobacter sp. CA1UV-4 TaxID=3063782 RepID=UPI002712EA25|nr:FG-GAP-like repeat-containing protein [Hymenobacter sp. CA1UV-4]MDO7851218.1 FG-GAP-like repeat-containing protein [Hymenobacter sp. CA1UV-4]
MKHALLGLLALLSATVHAQTFSVTGVAPARNATSAPRASAVGFTLSQPVSSGAATTGAVRVFSAQRGGKLAGAATASGSTVGFAPTVPFRPGETLQATLTTAAQSSTGTALAQPTVYQFTAAATAGTGLFGGGEVPVAASLDQIAAADVDGDNDLDLLALKYSGSVSIRLNDGSGAFSGSGTVAVSGGAENLAVGDVDNDGDLDLLTSANNSATVSLRLNNGSGGFSPGTDPNLGIGTNNLTLGDLDGDGDLDLAAVSSTGSMAIIRFNNGSGVFSGGQSFLVNQRIGTGLVLLADMDSDGDLDVVVGYLHGGLVGVHFNNGSGVFSSNTLGNADSPILTDSGITGLRAGDVDNDGDVDLLIAFRKDRFSSPNNLLVQLNNGTGSFTAAPVGTRLVIPAGADNLALADVDGDGDLDCVVPSQTDNLVSMCLNNGSGVFGLGSTVPVGPAPFGPAAADLDGDGDLDLLTASNSTGSVSVRFNLGPLVTSFTPARGTEGTAVTLTGANLAAATAVRFNGTAAVFTVVSANVLTATVPAGATTGIVSVDVPAGTSVSSTAFEVYFGLAIPRFLPRPNQPNAPRSAAVVAAFSQPVSGAAVAAGPLRVFSGQRGGRLAGTATASGSTVGFAPAVPFRPGETLQATLLPGAQNSAGSTITAPFVYQFTAAATGGNGTFSGGANLSVSSFPVNTVMADIDNDGDLDLLTANSNGGSVSVHLNSGRGVFTSGTTLAVNGVPYCLTTADIDGDGDLDLLLTLYGSNRVQLRLNNGNGTFAAATAVTVGTTPNTVVTGDLDGDGDLDLATANDVNTVSLRFNDGTGVFSGTTELSAPTGYTLFHLAAADVDNDGDLDLLLGYGTFVTVRLNDGSGTFVAGSTVTVGSSPRFVTAADIDNDGDLDLLTANYGSSSISIRQNNGQGIFSGTTDVSAGASPTCVTTADVDGDGDLDLLSTAYNIISSSVNIRLNNGSGVFGSMSSVSTASGTLSVVLGDLDDDGDLDLAACNYGQFTVTVRLNNGTGPALAARSAAAASPLVVWPNPAHAEVRVRVPAAASAVALVDAMGRTVRTVPIAASSVTAVTVPLVGLAAGIYVVRAGGSSARMVVQ